MHAQRWGRHWMYLYAPTLLVLIGMTAFPLLFSLVTSFTDYREMNPGYSFVGFSNFLQAFHDPEIGASFKNTIVYVFFSVGIELVLGMVLALLLSRKVRGITIVRTFLTLPMMVTPVAVALMWRWMFNADFGLINYLMTTWFGKGGVNWLGQYSTAMPVVIWVDVWQCTPFVMLCLLAGLQSMPDEPYEAAKIDGANRWQIFRYITLPQMKTIILVVVMIRMIDAFKSFDIVYILTNGGPGSATELFSLAIFNEAFQYFNTAYASAVSWIFLVFVMLLTFWFIRYLYRDERM